MNLSNNNNFITAAQIYKENNDSFNASFTFNTSVDSIDSSDSTSDSDDISSILENEPETSDEEDLSLPGDISQVKGHTELKNILIQFFVALKRKDGQPYAPTSIHNCFCGIAQHLLNNSCQDPKPNIFDKNQFFCLYSTIDGKIKLVQDTNPQQANKSDSLTNNKIAQILNQEELLQDTPTAIMYRVYFWLCLLCGLHGVWFYDSSLGRHAYKKMIKKICETMELLANSSRRLLAPISNSDNQVLHRIRSRITKLRPFKPLMRQSY
ncbi:4240_t:CDS:2, partial [Racocetra fulgida]